VPTEELHRFLESFLAREQTHAEAFTAVLTHASTAGLSSGRKTTPNSMNGADATQGSVVQLSQQQRWATANKRGGGAECSDEAWAARCAANASSMEAEDRTMTRSRRSGMNGSASESSPVSTRRRQLSRPILQCQAAGLSGNAWCRLERTSLRRRRKPKKIRSPNAAASPRGHHSGRCASSHPRS